MRTRPDYLLIKQLSSFEKLILINLAIDSQSSVNLNGRASVNSVASKIICTYPDVGYRGVYRIVSELHSIGLLELRDESRNHVLDGIVRMKITNMEIKAAIDDEEFERLMTVLQN